MVTSTSRSATDVRAINQEIADLSNKPRLQAKTVSELGKLLSQSFNKIVKLQKILGNGNLNPLLRFECYGFNFAVGSRAKKTPVADRTLHLEISLYSKAPRTCVEEFQQVFPYLKIVKRPLSEPLLTGYGSWLVFFTIGLELKDLPLMSQNMERYRELLIKQEYCSKHTQIEIKKTHQLPETEKRLTRLVNTREYLEAAINDLKRQLDSNQKQYQAELQRISRQAQQKYAFSEEKEFSKLREAYSKLF